MLKLVSVAYSFLILHLQEESGSNFSAPSQQAAVDSKISLQPSLLEKPSSLSQPLLTQHVFETLNPLADPPLDLLQNVIVFLVLWGPTQYTPDVDSPAVMKGEKHCSLLTLLLLMQPSMPMATFTKGA